MNTKPGASDTGASEEPPRTRWARARTTARKLTRGTLRGIGMMAGASLVLSGVSRRSLGGLIVAAGGAALATRTLTGHWIPRRSGPARATADAAAPGVEPEDATTRDLVDEAGYESFPASDPPAYSPR